MASNPVTMIAERDGWVRAKREANWPQRAIFRQNGKEILTVLPFHPNTQSYRDPIEKGTYEVTYEYDDGNGWKKGEKVKFNHSAYVQFDDGPAGTGDGDFNDLQIWFEY